MRRWLDILTRRPAPTVALVDPLTRCDAEIAEAVARRRAARLARPEPNEAKRFARARPMVERLRYERAMAAVDF
jgi:hypothetical protein